MKITIHTDGAASGNPGPGGYGAVLESGPHRKELWGGYRRTTNNRMELMAVIRGLEALRKPCMVELTTDSQYVMRGAQEWLTGWISRKWRTASGDPVKNRDLWERLHAAMVPHKVEWKWVRGHQGHIENERVDVLARQAAEAAREEIR